MVCFIAQGDQKRKDPLQCKQLHHLMSQLPNIAAAATSPAPPPPAPTTSKDSKQTDECTQDIIPLPPHPKKKINQPKQQQRPQQPPKQRPQCQKHPQNNNTKSNKSINSSSGS